MRERRAGGGVTAIDCPLALDISNFEVINSSSPCASSFYFETLSAPLLDAFCEGYSDLHRSAPVKLARLLP